MQLSPPFLLSACLVLAVAPLASRATPLLQLDALPGVYDTTDQTIYATQNPFTVAALYDGSKRTPAGEYFVSAAIVPKVGIGTTNVPAADFGSFRIGGVTYSAAAGNMTYGGPPVDSLYPDLPYHGIYATWYAEIPFTFDPAQRAKVYNSQDHPGGLVIPPVVTPAHQLYYQLFSVDAAQVASGYAVHFDLYDEVVKYKRGGYDYDINFAPFSHDAQSRTRVPDSTAATLFLLSGALGVLSWYRRWHSPARSA